MFTEIAAYAFGGLIAWGLVAIIGFTLHYLQLKIRTRQGILKKMNELHAELELAIEKCDNARLTYEQFLAELQAETVIAQSFIKH